jgi:glucokinase
MAENNTRNLLAGVDAGGTKVAVLIADAQGAALSRATFATDLSSPENTVAGIAAAVRETLARGGASPEALAAIGLGTPGRVDPETGVVRNAVNLKWEALPVGTMLSAALGAPCFLENDVRVAALGVQAHPAHAGVRDLAYIGIGTGIAAGIILNGRLHRGAHGMAGEIGHMIVDPPGPRCECGSHGCLEALAAGPAIARLAAQAVAAGAETALRAAHPLTTAAVYEAAGRADLVALEITRQVGRRLAQALQQLIMAYDVERVVLGGGVTRAGAAFLHPILEELARMRADSPLAAEMLPAQKFHLLPPDYDAGTWGAVTLARVGRGESPTPPRDDPDGAAQREPVYQP